MESAGPGVRSGGGGRAVVAGPAASEGDPRLGSGTEITAGRDTNILKTTDPHPMKGSTEERGKGRAATQVAEKRNGLTGRVRETEDLGTVPVRRNPFQPVAAKRQKRSRLLKKWMKSERRKTH